MIKLLRDDCNKAMRRIRSNSIDTIITDPPYALKFMSKKWDYELPSIRCFKRMLRVAKPGAFLLCFGGTRTYHRLACNIEDAGWHIRDCIMWIYGSGFPKSHNISKAIDKAKGRKRKVVGKNPNCRPNCLGKQTRCMQAKITVQPITAPASNKAKLWNGWGTGLKPAFEPIIVAMKPLEGNFAANAEQYGVAGLNIDGARISAQQGERFGGGGLNSPQRGFMAKAKKTYQKGTGFRDDTAQGRWPANLILDEEVGKMLDAQTGVLPGPWGKNSKEGKLKGSTSMFHLGGGFCDNERLGKEVGGPSRFFYCAKASKKERNLGTINPNNHPTVKPLSLMRYLCKLTQTPTGGLVLDPFAGTGTTGMACKLEGRHFIGIELDKEYFTIARLRIKHTDRKVPKHGIPAEKIFKA